VRNPDGTRSQLDVSPINASRVPALPTLRDSGWRQNPIPALPPARRTDVAMVQLDTP
jgi:hypothetical protein